MKNLRSLKNVLATLPKTQREMLFVCQINYSITEREDRDLSLILVLDTHTHTHTGIIRLQDMSIQSCMKITFWSFSVVPTFAFPM